MRNSRDKRNILREVCRSSLKYFHKVASGVRVPMPDVMSRRAIIKKETEEKLEKSNNAKRYGGMKGYARGGGSNKNIASATRNSLEIYAIPYKTDRWQPAIDPIIKKCSYDLYRVSFL